MSPETFKNITGGIHSIVVAVGILVAGLWTYQTFGGFEQTGPIVDVTLRADTYQDVSANSGYLHVVATVLNRGKTQVQLDFAGANPLVVAHVAATDEEMGYKVVADAGVLAAEEGKIVQLRRVTLLPSVSKSYSFLVPAQFPGVYFATFTVPWADHPGTVWSGSTYIEFKPPPLRK